MCSFFVIVYHARDILCTVFTQIVCRPNWKTHSSHFIGVFKSFLRYSASILLKPYTTFYQMYRTHTNMSLVHSHFGFMDGLQIMNPTIQPPSATAQPLGRRIRNRTPMHTVISEIITLREAAQMEMSSKTAMTKTPVSVLQELLSRRGITPKYELVQIEGAIHEPTFRYRVFLNSEYIATGTGRSKKEAKHAAAKNLLDLLIGKMTLEQVNQSVTGAAPHIVVPLPPENTNQVVSPYDDKVMGNPIGWLQEMCMSRRWPPPAYDMEHEEGLPHERSFTIACQVLKFKEIGTGKSKKMAKRMAAHKMWQSLQDLPTEGATILPGYDDYEEVSQTAHHEKLLARLPNIHSRYAGLKDSKISTLQTANSNHTQKLSQFHKYMAKVNGPILNDLQNSLMANAKEFCYVKFLKDLSTEQNFDVTYVDIDEKSITGKYQCLVQLSTLPVAVCYGSAGSPKEAQAVAARNALEYLKLMTRK